MERYYRTLGIVLKKRNWREDDLLFSIYTENFGRVEALAVGARKIQSKLAGHLAAPGAVELVLVAGRRQKKITHACVRRVMPLRGEADFRVWDCFTELLDKLSHEEKDERLWRLAWRFGERFTEARNFDTQKLLLNIFIIKALAILGYDIFKAKPGDKLKAVLAKLAARSPSAINQKENDYLFKTLHRYLLIVAEKPIHSMEFIG